MLPPGTKTVLQGSVSNIESENHEEKCKEYLYMVLLPPFFICFIDRDILMTNN